MKLITEIYEAQVIPLGISFNRWRNGRTRWHLRLPWVRFGWLTDADGGVQWFDWVWSGPTLRSFFLGSDL